MSNVKELQKTGQSIWFDYISRGLIDSGELQRMVKEDGLLGVTSNPSIFEKAIAGSTEYDETIRQLVDQSVGDAKSLYEHLAIQDIRRAAACFRPTYDATNGVDGYVSLEVSPYRAHDMEATLVEARRLHAAVDRPNVMIKVPATRAGIPAIRQLIAGGIPVNVTLLFSVETYREAAEAYLAGLEQRAANGGDLGRVASVASFFISRIDALVDDQLQEMADQETDSTRRQQIQSLHGEVAIANARVAYSAFRTIVASERWKKLEQQGAQPQRLLWASTSTKNPDFSKTKYVHALNGPQTVNTLPAETYTAIHQESAIRAELESGPDRAHEQLALLERLGFSLEAATDRLLDEGVRKFSAAFDGLLAVVETRRIEFLGDCFSSQSLEIGSNAAAIDQALETWREEGTIRKLWNRDTSVWTGGDEDRWLGWLDGVDRELDGIEFLENFSRRIREEGFKHIVLLGMGGSSLCPWVIRETFGLQANSPELLVLDSIIPDQVDSIVQRIDVEHTLFIVASKSGGTTEPNVLMRFFLDLAGEVLPESEVGSHFVAITDPDSALHRFAQETNFRHAFLGVPSIGGRYSAFSPFGMVPTSLSGVNTRDFLESARGMARACSAFVPPRANPGVQLGVALGTLALSGRDKVTFVTSPGLASLGAWLEQLIAESTGKNGHGLIPIAGEQIGSPDVYDSDRVFVHTRDARSATSEEDAAVQALVEAGHPMIRISVQDPQDLGQEFFRWEIATAVAGSVLGVHPFDQPDVEAAKIATRSLMAEYETSGSLPKADPFASQGPLHLYAGGLTQRCLPKSEDLVAILRAHLEQLRAGDYFAINAYLEQNSPHEEVLCDIRLAVRRRFRVATTVGFGPRFLHSTGQLHKGGPNSGVFLQITAGTTHDAKIPGQQYTFQTLAEAQAQGDFEVLAERDRRLLRIELGTDVATGLDQLRSLIEQAIG